MTKLYLFTAGWCAVCGDMRERLLKITPEYKVEVIDKDIEDADNVQLLNDYGVRSIPTLIVANPDDSMISRVVGLMEEFQIRNLLDDCVD